MGTSAATRPATSSLGDQLVATKLHVPVVRAGWVPRAELVRRLAAADGRKLTLVCAPAGWGKTVLLSQWQAAPEEERPFAWVSLDPADDDPVRFWAYLIAALRTVDMELGARSSAALPNAGPALVDAVVAPLITELDARPGRLVLVLDDYHLVRNEQIQASVAFLLRHLPRSLQLALASRADPPLPLARLRAAGELTEIRAAALGFSDAEANALLNDSLGLGLERADVELLQTRTEGWAAGLQLAALSLRGQDDRRAFLEAFAGDDRQIGEYLSEVLADQPAQLRDFLLRTSILERLCAPLCDAVTGVGDAAQQLEAIERANLFLVPLDTRREWYRYHHLFRDLLRHELTRTRAELVDELHRRAAAWHRNEGDVDEAIAHATAAGEFSEARELIAGCVEDTAARGQYETLARWIDALPPSTSRADARLCVTRAWAALELGKLDEAASWRHEWDLEAWPGSGEGDAGSEFRAVAFDAAYASRVGDAGGACEAASLVVASFPDETDVRRAYAKWNLGDKLYLAGELASAATCFEEATRRLADSEPSLPATQTLVGGYAYLAAIRADLGEFDQAERSAAEADRLIGGAIQEEIVWGIVHVARGKLLELRGDLAGAESAFARAEAFERQERWPLDHAHSLLLLARLKHRLRKHAEARVLAREAREVLRPCPDPGMLRELLLKTERSLQLSPAPASSPMLPADLELSERELMLLRLLASELSQREIGAQLYISVNTVKGHVRSIFRKLGVADRDAAVARARELSLL